ncbi:MAG TPA: triose-phosphate isomerase [Microscillaceae bacterium]|nr:triose-phosphate isomerase [Microscillaceae bacterium]
MRQKIVAGNWKMNNSLNEGIKLTSEVVNMVQDELTNGVQVILGCPFIHLTSVQKLTNGTKVALSAQNVHQEEKGAYTGEVSATMLKSVPVQYVIIGHSERREYFQENNELLAKKVDILLKHELLPIFCCGESLDIREAGNHVEFVCNQLKESLFHLEATDFAKLVIAYEPIWAIGTGVTASTAQAQEMHLALRNFIAEKYGQEIADNTSILYGGSVKPANAQELFACPDVDGGLVGGASLKSRDFVDIAKSFS